MAKSTRSSARSGPKKAYIIGGIVVLALIVVYLVSTARRPGGATEPVQTVMDAATIQQAVGIKWGPDGAPVTMYEFADFQCPGCQQFSTFFHPLIKERLIDRGILQMIRYDFPIIGFHPHAFLAARAGRCANDQQKFWEFHDYVYGRQTTWSGLPDPSREFGDYAEIVGMDRGAFEDCLNSDEHAEEVTRNMRLGESLGVSGTPMLMINGELISPTDFSDLEARVFEAAGMTLPAQPGMPVIEPAVPAPADTTG